MASLSSAEVAEISTLLGTQNEEAETEEAEVSEQESTVVDDSDGAGVSDDTQDTVVDSVEAEVSEDEVDEIVEAVDTVEDGYTLSSLADAIEMEPSDLYQVQIPMGEGEDAMSISDMKDAYVDLKKASDIAAAAPDPVERQQVDYNEMQAQVQSAALQDEYNAIDWVDMEEFEPAQAVLKKQKFQERYMQIQSQMAQAQEYQRQQHQEQMNTAWTTTLEKIPEWSDVAVRDKDIRAISDVLTSVGLPADMVGQIEMPEVMVLLKELATLRNVKAGAAKAAVRVKKAPKVLKARGGVAQATDNQKTDLLVKKAKTSGNKNDEFAAMKALLDGRL